MESSKKAWKHQEKKKMTVKFGGGGIGAVVLLGGALAAAAVASAFVARGKRRSQIPPPPENNNNKLCQHDEERVESNGDVEVRDQILSSVCPKKMEKDDVIHDEKSPLMEEKLPLIKEDVSCDHLKGKRNLEIDFVEREDNHNGVEGVQITRIDVKKEEGVEEFCSEEKSLEVVERVKVDLSEDSSDQERVGNNASLLEIDGEDGEKGLVPVFESLVIEDKKKEGGFIVEIVREDEAIEESREGQVEYVEEKCDEPNEGVGVEWIGGVRESGEDQVENVEEKCDEVDDVIEVEGIGEAIEESQETQVEFVEEKCDEPNEVIEVERFGEAKQSRGDQVEYVEDKSDKDNEGIEVESIVEAIQESREDQVEYLEEKCDESNEGIEVESIGEAIEESQEDQVEFVEENSDESGTEVEHMAVAKQSREDQVEYVEGKCDEANDVIEVELIGEAIQESQEDQVEYVEEKCDVAKDGAKEEVLESLVLNHENETLEHCPVSPPKDEEAPLRTKDGLITEMNNDKDDKIHDVNDGASLSDEAEESSVGTRDSSTESSSEVVWPAESLNDSSINNYQVEEDFPTSHKVSPIKFGMIKDHSTNSTRRRMVIATLSLLTSLSCSWFFDLSLVNTCLVVFLTMLLSEIHGY